MFTGPKQLLNQAVNEVSATKMETLGTLAVTADGRKFRYARGGAADIVAANLLVAANPTAAHVNMAIAAAAAIGDKTVSVTLGAAAATINQYQDGYLIVNDGVGEGYSYRIAGHAAHAGSGTLKVRLVDPIEVALTTAGSEVSLVANPYADIVISATDQADLPVGIAHCAVDVSVAPYFWVQTGGFATCWADEAFDAGDQLTIGTGVAGQVEMLDAVGEPPIGISLDVAVDTEYRSIMLKLD
jgi:hypothetical protein